MRNVLCKTITIKVTNNLLSLSIQKVAVFSAISVLDEQAHMFYIPGWSRCTPSTLTLSDSES